MSDKLKVYRCESCGNVFPHEDEDALSCPLCGSEDVHVASEPLL